MNLRTGLAFLIFFPFVMGVVSYLTGSVRRISNRSQHRLFHGEILSLTPKNAQNRRFSSEFEIPQSGIMKVGVRRREAAGVKEGQENLRDALTIGAAALEFLCAIALCAVAVASRGSLGNGGGQSGVSLSLPKVCGLGLNFTLDGFRAVYVCVAAFMWMMATVFSREYFARLHDRSRFYLFMLWTLGAIMGVFLSADLYTTFLFFEVMSFTSYAWVAQEENERALRAASTYLAVAVFGGLVMLMGIFLLYHRLGTVMIEDLKSAAAGCSDRNVLYAAGACMLVGFGAKAGAFPLHIWLPKAHPLAPAPASALLSGILTKTGIYGILILGCHIFFHDGFWGSIVLALGVITMFWGAFLAVFSVDLKRTLACSSMSQIGFILVGIGMQGLSGEENALAVYALAGHGTFLHMVNHSLIKLVLFIAAGVIYRNTNGMKLCHGINLYHGLDLNRIRGFGRKKPLLAVAFLAGALAIGGIPLFGGYISKTLLHESIVEYGGGAVMKAVEWIFLFSGGMTAAYMTKLFAAIFLERNVDASLQDQYDHMARYMSPATTFALGGSAAVLLIWGSFPHAIMDRAAGLAQQFMGLEETGHRTAYFSQGNLKGALTSIAIGTVLYLFFIRKCLVRKRQEGGSEYINAWPEWLDLEELVYRPLLLKVLPEIFGGVCGLLDRLCGSARALRVLSTICATVCRILDSFVDSVVVLLRKTLYRDSPPPHERLEGNVFTECLGRLMNAIQAISSHTWRKDDPNHRDYVHLVAMRNEQFKETNRLIQRSLSFGLLLVCIGLALTLLYIIWW